MKRSIMMGTVPQPACSWEVQPPLVPVPDSNPLLVCIECTLSEPAASSADCSPYTNQTKMLSWLMIMLIIMFQNKSDSDMKWIKLKKGRKSRRDCVKRKILITHGHLWTGTFHGRGIVYLCLFWWYLSIPADLEPQPDANREMLQKHILWNNVRMKMCYNEIFTYFVEFFILFHSVQSTTEQWPAPSPDRCWDALLTLTFDLRKITECWTIAVWLRTCDATILPYFAFISVIWIWSLYLT